MSHQEKRERSLIIRHLETMTIRGQEGLNQWDGGIITVHSDGILICVTHTQMEKLLNIHVLTAAVLYKVRSTQYRDLHTHRDRMETVKSFPPIRAPQTSVLMVINHNEQQEISFTGQGKLYIPHVGHSCGHQCTFHCFIYCTVLKEKHKSRALWDKTRQQEHLIESFRIWSIFF